MNHVFTRGASASRVKLKSTLLTRLCAGIGTRDVQIKSIERVSNAPMKNLLVFRKVNISSGVIMIAYVATLPSTSIHTDGIDTEN